MIQRSLLKAKDGGAAAGPLMTVKLRFLSFQFLQTTVVLFLSKTLLFSPFTKNPFSAIFETLVYFVWFHLSLLLFSISLLLVSSPRRLPSVSPFEISSFVLFVCLCAVAGAVSAISVCWGCDVYYDIDSGSNRVAALGFRGFVIGLIFGLHYVYNQRWVLKFPIIQVLHTKRFVFASAAADTNPVEPLLATIEESTPNSLLQYLAYLDLCMVCENNVDPWRRAAFFEETGETYKRVIAACLRPLEQFTRKLAQALESSSMQLSDQLTSPQKRLAVLELYRPFFDAQLCAWCARVIASLTLKVT